MVKRGTTTDAKDKATASTGGRVKKTNQKSSGSKTTKRGGTKTRGRKKE